MKSLFSAKRLCKSGFAKKTAALGLSLVFMLGTLGALPAALAAEEFVELTGGLDIYNATSTNNGTVGRTVIAGQTYIAAAFGTAAWASSNAYNFNNGSRSDYRAAFDAPVGDGQSGSQYFDGQTLGHCGLEFKEPQIVSRIGYRARQSADRLNGAVFEGSEDGVSYETLFTLNGASSSTFTYRTASDGLKLRAYKFFRVRGTNALNGALNIYELKLYKYGDGNGVLAGLSLPAEVYADLTLPAAVTGYPITWVSGTPDVMTSDGRIVAPTGVRPVTASLTATIQWEGQPYSRTFNMSVRNYEPARDSDVVKDMELIASFNFDVPAAGLAGAGAKANVHGTPSYVIGRSGTPAANLSSNFWLDVTKQSGASLLAGLSEFTVSYDSSPAVTNNNGWAFFAARTTRAPKNQYESYLGIIDKTASVDVERFHNFGARPAFGLYATPTDSWRHVDVVFSKTSTKLYIDGQLKNIQTSDFSPEEVLSAAGGILYVGRSTWGGENFTGLIDNFKIWKPVDPDDAGKVAAAKAELKLPYGVTDNQVYGNITLPKTGLYGTAISWATDAPAIVDVSEHANPGYDPRLPGTVTRPAADTVVTMTATLVSGSARAEKVFRFTVKKAPAPLADTEAYIFAHFTGTEGSATDEQMYFATSLDGTNWKDLRPAGQPILRSTIGDRGVRDPYILRAPEGDKFYLIATDLNINLRGGWGNASWQNSSTKMAIWESTDLVNWGEMRLVEIAGGIPDAGNLWAPEAIYDEVTGDYFVFWATYSTVSNALGDAQNMYYSRTRDFYSFTTPVKWMDESNSVIDTSIIEVGGSYFRASQTGAISIDRSSPGSLTGAWTRLGTLQNIFSGAWTYGAVEGPEFFLYNKKDWQGGVPTWGLMVDQYGTGSGYKPFRTTGVETMSRDTWSVGNDINFGSLKKRHGSIMAVTKAEYDAFMAAYGTVTQPDTYPDSFALPSDMSLLVDCDFNTLPDGGTVSEIAAGDLAKAGVNGTPSRSADTPDSSAFAASISNTFWLNLTKKDGSPLLTGRDEIVVSFDSKPSAASNTGWAFFAAPNTNTQTYLNEHYLGIMDTVSNVTVERYNNTGARPGNNLGGTSSAAWKHIDLVVRPGSGALYINGQRVSTQSSNYKLSDILSATGGVIQIGKGNWGSGEYYRGLIDNLKIFAAPVKPAQLLTGVKAQTPAFTTIRSDFNAKTKQIKLFISRNNSLSKDLTAVPLTFTVFAGADVVNPQAAYDLTAPVGVTVTYGGGAMTENWTISAELCNNPVLPGRYADPDILRSNGRYYIYPTTDGYAGWSGFQFKVFSSEDMINWEDEGVIVDLQASQPYANSEGVAVATVPWSNGNAWAPAIEEKNGKYYFYFCGNDILNTGNRKAIGVAVSDSPTGPFTVRPTPLITLTDCQNAGVGMGQVIDPQIYTENGTSYMLFGNGNAAIVQLGEDMMSLVPGTLKNIAGATDLREAIDVIKIDGMYHFTWSCDDTGSENYLVRYGISDSLYGPILHKGILLQKDNANDIKGTGHHSILYHPERNEYYIVYHRFWTPLGQSMPGGLGNNRETCIDKLTYKDGLFQTTKPTLAGITEPVYALENGTVFSLRAPEPNAALAAETYITNKSGAGEKGSVILAVYDGQGRLVEVKTAAFDVADNGHAVVKTGVTLPADVTGLTVKVFVWSDGFVPLRPDAELK